MGWKLKARNGFLVLFAALLLLLPFAIAVGPFAFQLADAWWLDRENRAIYHERKALLEAIVRKMELEVVAPGTLVTYAFADRVEDVRKIGSDQKWRRSDWTIFASRGAKGHLRVEIRTFNRGRLGVWSVNYSSRARTQEERQKDEAHYAVTSFDAHWWAAVFAD
jgi:hypothetical protein